MMRRNILRDTILLTAIQLALDGLTVLLNVFLTAQLGTEAIGMLTLSSSFLRLASVTAGGNVFLCASRFLSEELGKPGGSPRRVLWYCMAVSLVLSGVTSTAILLTAPWCSSHFLQSTQLAAPIRLMAAFLPLMTAASCLKGCLNAFCRTGSCAAADAVEFLVRTACTAAIVLGRTPQTHAGLCMMTSVSAAAGAGAAFLFLLCRMPACRLEKGGYASVTCAQYIRLAVPVMAGSVLTSALSYANDALVPMTLRQSGSSSAEALAQFGIFEGIILPVLFFPSAILCSLSGILITEAARESAACNRIRITAMTEKAVRQTIVFAVFVTAMLLCFGDELGELLGGGVTAGKMIVLLAPVVPFIYLEIVLEGIIKGLGAQAFSSLNYLCEYIIRISCVLIFIPIMGFYGIVLSYYASNVFGNLSRLVLVIRRTGMTHSPVKLIGIPVFAAVLGTQLAAVCFSVLHTAPGAGIPGMLCFAAISCGVYFAVQHELFRLYQWKPAPELPSSCR